MRIFGFDQYRSTWLLNNLHFAQSQVGNVILLEGEYNSTYSTLNIYYRSVLFNDYAHCVWNSNDVSKDFMEGMYEGPTIDGVSILWRDGNNGDIGRLFES